MNREIYNSMAALLSYPDNEHVARVQDALAAIGDRQSATAREVALFAGLTEHMHTAQVQELFIQTFDLTPVCSLEMGWHLFGENYDRGLLLVKVRQLLRACGVPEGTELPDHLTYALRVAPRMESGAAEYFVEAVVLPALGKMIAALEGKDNPYTHLLLAVNNLLHTDFPGIRFAGAATGGELRVLA